MALYKHKYQGSCGEYMVRVESETLKVQVVKEEVITEKVVGVTLNLTEAEARFLVENLWGLNSPLNVCTRLSEALDG